MKNVVALNVIVDLAFIDFTCSSDYLYMQRNRLRRTRDFNFIVACCC